jgi:hypothetical protein
MQAAVLVPCKVYRCLAVLHILGGTIVRVEHLVEVSDIYAVAVKSAMGLDEGKLISSTHWCAVVPPMMTKYS